MSHTIRPCSVGGRFFDHSVEGRRKLRFAELEFEVEGGTDGGSWVVGQVGGWGGGKDKLGNLLLLFKDLMESRRGEAGQNSGRVERGEGIEVEACEGERMTT